MMDDDDDDDDDDKEEEEETSPTCTKNDAIKMRARRARKAQNIVREENISGSRERSMHGHKQD